MEEAAAGRRWSRIHAYREALHSLLNRYAKEWDNTRRQQQHHAPGANADGGAAGASCSRPCSSRTRAHRHAAGHAAGHPPRPAGLRPRSARPAAAGAFLYMHRNIIARLEASTARSPQLATRLDLSRQLPAHGNSGELAKPARAINRLLDALNAALGDIASAASDLRLNAHEMHGGALQDPAAHRRRRIGDEEMTGESLALGAEIKRRPRHGVQAVSQAVVRAAATSGAPAWPCSTPRAWTSARWASACSTPASPWRR